MLHVFRSNHHCSWKFHKFHRKTPVLESVFKKVAGLFHVCFSLYPIIHVNNIKSHRLYKHFYGFLENDLWKLWKKKTLHNKHIYIYGSQTFWSFVRFCFLHMVKVHFVFKNSHYAYIPPYMHKTLPTLGNEKEQYQIKFYKNSSEELIFLQATKK